MVNQKPKCKKISKGLKKALGTGECTKNCADSTTGEVCRMNI